MLLPRETERSRSPAAGNFSVSSATEVRSVCSGIVSWQNQRSPATSFIYSGRKMAFQSCFMSTTSQPRLGASLRASISLPVLFVLAS